MHWNDELKKIAEEDLQPGYERITIILKSDSYNKLKSISDIKGLFVKDIITSLIDIYNKHAITDKDKKNIENEKINLTEEIKELIQLEEGG
jgi:hypothetical protein